MIDIQFLFLIMQLDNIYIYMCARARARVPLTAQTVYHFRLIKSISQLIPVNSQVFITYEKWSTDSCRILDLSVLILINS
jgi:hypothetical protein